MDMPTSHSAAHGEAHFLTRIGWLRAAVLGANDGLLSTSSLMVGVAAAAAAPGQIILTGVAGIAAGAMAMAAGEYVSVSSQADSENADIERERREHLADPEYERRELVAIYVDRGLPHPLAEQVADALSENGALEAHLRDELGISDHSIARPAQAAIASAASFVTGGIVPLLTVLFVAEASAIWAISAVAIVALALLGAAGAKAGGAPLAAAIVRVVLFGSLAMATTAGVGRIFHVAAG